MLDKTFRPGEVESRLYRMWEDSGAFRPAEKPGAGNFCIVIPPPNITGSLHIGHALNNTLQDVLARFERMRGKNVLWQPGTDHAGIATQLVVERKLAERQLSRSQMGRGRFLEEVWRWKAESGGTIVRQLRRLGASCDWSRERFTMDEGLSRAVLKVFVALHKEGLIYKAKRLVNWDPRLQTAVSDLEVENIEVPGRLWYVRYPVEGRESQFITVATTRPETMLGDVAVAVHPDDERYQALIGARLRLPLTQRIIPVIADSYSDPEKGTGAVKITPAHDFNDFEVGKRHGLTPINILNPDGTMFLKDNRDFSIADPKHESEEILRTIELLDGKDRFEARKHVVSALETRGLIERVEDIFHAVPHDEKTKTVVLEPYLTEQWYLNVSPLAEKALKAVEDGCTKFVPGHWTQVYFNWMRNIQPWCISRQLWWGHQIPVWYGPPLGGQGMFQLPADFLSSSPRNNWLPFVAETENEALQQAGLAYSQTGISVSVARDRADALEAFSPYLRGKSNAVKIYRDPDVLDTWFSSALWPFSTLGWPEQTAELRRFYPTSVLVTGFDIIFFWVARMMMMGLHFMRDVPFHDVCIHTRVLDEKGQKMSKTKGNVVDPLDLIGEYGADALRFALANAAGQGRDIRLGINRVETCRNFGTKLWNAARFCEMNECVRKRDFDPATVTMTANQWIVAEVGRAVADVTSGLEAYRFNDAASAIYRFVWDVFCDWYLEFIKPVLNGADEEAKAETRDTAAWALDRILQLLHPFMPFITEELWARMAEHAVPRRSMLMLSPWPPPDALPAHDAARAEMNWLIELISGIRSVRSEMHVPPSARISLVLKDADATTMTRCNTHRDIILTMGRLSSARVGAEIPPGSAQFVAGEAIAALPLGDVIDLAQERTRLQKDLKKAEDEMARFDAKLNNPAFVARAPEEVIEEQKEKRAEAAAVASRLGQALQRLQA